MLLFLVLLIKALETWTRIYHYYYDLLRQALASISLSEYPGGSPEFDDSGFRVETRRQL